MVNQVNQCSACVCVCVCVCVCGPTAAWTEHTHRHSGLPLPPDVVDRLMKQGQLEVGWRVRVAKTPHRSSDRIIGLHSYENSKHSHPKGLADADGVSTVDTYDLCGWRQRRNAGLSNVSIRASRVESSVDS